MKHFIAKNKSPAKTLSVLKCISADISELEITEIFNRLKFNKSNLYIILRLTYMAMSNKIFSNNQYHLYLGVLKLASIVKRPRPQCDLIFKLVRNLAIETGETTYHGIQKGNSILYLDYMSNANMIIPKQMQIVGFTTALNHVATLESISSMITKNEVEEIILSGMMKIIENTITNSKKLKKEFGVAHVLRYSIDKT